MVMVMVMMVVHGCSHVYHDSVNDGDGSSSDGNAGARNDTGSGGECGGGR